MAKAKKVVASDLVEMEAFDYMKSRNLIFSVPKDMVENFRLTESIIKRVEMSDKITDRDTKVIYKDKTTIAKKPSSELDS